MTQQLPIAQLGHPILRKKAQTVNNISEPSIQNLISDMLNTVESAGGVGIAAPQTHHSKQIFIMCSKPNERYPNAPLMLPTVIVNPTILSHSETKEKDWEGCLSVPKMRGLVPRYTEIEVSYFDQHANKFTRHYQGFLARIFQHEMDHLNGIVFVDRVESTLDLCSEAEWYRQYVN